MPSNEEPRTPQKARVASGIEASATQMSSAIKDTQLAQSKEVDKEFFKTHARQCPGHLVEQLQMDPTVVSAIEDIGAVKNIEVGMYNPLAKLLTTISTTIHSSFPPEKKQQLDLPSHVHPILFLNHSGCPLSEFPTDDVEDKPDLVGVYGHINEFSSLKHGNTGTYKAMPYHRVETVVEAKSRTKEGGRAQAASYIYHAQQARPDRPGYYGLSAKPQYFQVLYSSPAGVAASEHRQWSDLQNLCDYVYSLYDPPEDHFLYDRTISWSESKKFGPPTWTITVGGERYSGAMLTFIGRVWGRRTTIFMVRREGLPPIVIKEYYLHSGRQYEESHLLSLIHADGFMPGVVRLICAEEVLTHGKSIVFKYTEGQDSKEKSWTKQRLVLADSGLDLELAGSVNDILMTFYDLLEVHRTVTRERRVLHRDISLFNILMYPMAVKCADAAWAKECPPLIDDVLQGRKRDAENRTAWCVLIDYDNGALLEESNKRSEELQNRTGTPVYIARAVAVRRVVLGTRRYLKMPTLSEEARSLYISAYGEERYERYNDTGKTYHGGTKYTDDDEFDQQARSNVPFYHRWEYDAESVFWTMFSLLLRVLPRDGIENNNTAKSLAKDWVDLTTHSIPDKETMNAIDKRDAFLTRFPDAFGSAFLPVMQDVATLIGNIARQVGPSYRLMEAPPPHEDHLHEAMQRLILDYLVKHRDNPIPLTPGVMRALPTKLTDGGRVGRGRYSIAPITMAPSITVSQSIPVMQSTPTSTMSSKHSRDEDEDEAPEAKRPRVAPKPRPKKTPPLKLEPLPQPRDDDPLALKGLWTWSMFSAERDRILAAPVLAK